MKSHLLLRKCTLEHPALPLRPNALNIVRRPTAVGTAAIGIAQTMSMMITSVKTTKRSCPMLGGRALRGSGPVMMMFSSMLRQLFPRYRHSALRTSPGTSMTVNCALAPFTLVRLFAAYRVSAIGWAVSRAWATVTTLARRTGMDTAFAANSYKPFHALTLRADGCRTTVKLRELLLKIIC